MLLALDSIAWIALTGVKAAGFGLGELFRWSLSQEVVETGFGRAWAIRALLGVALAVVAVVAHRRRSAPAALLLFLGSAIAVTPALSGHARLEGALGILSDAVHVLAAGVWAGGLAFLALVLVAAGGGRWSLAATAVPRFSLLAVASVIALAATGLVSGFLEVRSLDVLWNTTYGQLLLAKAALLVPLVALGAYNNRVSVPRLRAAPPAAPARRAFARVVGLELALLLIVVGVTTALVAEPPAKAQAAASSGPVSREGKIGPYTYEVTVDPARTGANAVHVYLLDSHRPARATRTRWDCRRRCRRSTWGRSSSAIVAGGPRACDGGRGTPASRHVEPRARRPQGRVRRVERGHGSPDRKGHQCVGRLLP